MRKICSVALLVTVFRTYTLFQISTVARYPLSHIVSISLKAKQVVPLMELTTDPQRYTRYETWDLDGVTNLKDFMGFKRVLEAPSFIDHVSIE